MKTFLSRSNYISVIEKLDAVIIVLNNNGEMLYINPYAQALLGFDYTELMGKKWWKPENNEGNPVVNPAIFRRLSWLADDMFPLKAERAMKNARGRVLTLQWTVSRNSDHTYLLIGSDISALKKKQEEVRFNGEELRRKNQELTQSIEYARRLQQSTLPNPGLLNRYFSDFFVYFKPKEVLSGDYFFIKPHANGVRVAAVDCTGHGVPGAMLSVLASSLLNDVVNECGNATPVAVLELLDTKLFGSINNSASGSPVYDGMDIALIDFNPVNGRLLFSGAMRSLLIVREDEVIEIQGTRRSIGYYDGEVSPFEMRELYLEKGDSLYIFSDGYHDQFGGDKDKKLTKRRFKELLLSIREFTLAEQESYLEYALNNWKQDKEQTDDILVIGLRV